MTSLLIGVFFFCFSEESKEAIVDDLFFFGEICVYSNLISMFIYPDGMYKSYYYGNYYLSYNWILGNKNTFFTYYIVFFAIASIMIVDRRKQIRAAVLIAVMGYSAVICKSTTLLVSYFIMVVLSILVIRFDLERIINGRSMLLTSLAAFFIVVVFRLIGPIAILLGKKTTLSGRTLLWNQIFRLVSGRMLIGYGYTSEGLINATNLAWAQHAHNTILQTVYEGGLVELAFYFLFLIGVSNVLYIHRSHKEIAILNVAFFSFNIASLTEFYSRGHTYIILGLIIGAEGIYGCSNSISMARRC